MGKRTVLQQFSVNYNLFGVLHASAKEITLFLSNEFLSQLFTKVTCFKVMPTQAFRHEVMRFLLLPRDRELEICKWLIYL